MLTSYIEKVVAYTDGHDTKVLNDVLHLSCKANDFRIRAEPIGMHATVMPSIRTTTERTHWIAPGAPVEGTNFQFFNSCIQDFI